MKRLDSSNALLLQRLELAITNSGFGFWEYDIGRGVLTWDRQMCQIYGVDPETFKPTREQWREFVHPDDRDIGSKRFESAVQGELGGLFESRIVRPDGAIVHIEGSGRMQYSADGKPQVLFGLNRDITERKNAELHQALVAHAMTLIAERQPLKTVLSSIVDRFEETHSSVFCSILLLDESGEHFTLGAGPKLEPFFERYVRNFEIEVSPDDPESWLRRRVVVEDVTQDKRWIAHRQYAAEAGFKAYWSEPISLGNRILGSFSIYHPHRQKPSKYDLQLMEFCAQLASLAISRHQMEEALEQERAKLLSSIKMAALGEMASGIAHEINNPLTIIVGKAWQLKRFAEDAKENADIDRLFFADELSNIVDVSNRIAKVIKGLQSFSRNAEKDPLERVSTVQIIEDALALSRERFRNNGVDLRFELPDESIKIAARPAQLAQVLVNLLNNAFDAVVHKRRPWVEISVAVHQRVVEISVMDSGTGLDPAIADKIMQPFFTTKEVGKGTGLGLSISKGIVEDHAGRFYYDPTSRYTRFVIEIPSAE